jgi:hypothetical protein
MGKSDKGGLRGSVERNNAGPVELTRPGDRSHARVPRYWASVRALYFIALLCLNSCRTAEPNWKPVSSSVVSGSEGPIEFSLDEIATRKWIQDPGQTVGLIGRETFDVSAPERLGILVAKYGIAESNQLVCIDFYAVREHRAGKTYYLLCHDQNCPAYRTNVRCETQDRRTILTISGENREPGSSKAIWTQYYFELNAKCQMVRGFSEFTGPFSE